MIDVGNTGTVDDTYQLTLEGVPESWQVVADPAEVVGVEVRKGPPSDAGRGVAGRLGG